ncbi:unnamed protein product [Effrenium voratum]|uniref:GINS subunit domain-containing protein n=1 Tax=Effrenium voratum TaxID=2562239 RepID=A0AA36NHT4_9DINO|nr:unnamed protein product [Effrenium voratum]
MTLHGRKAAQLLQDLKRARWLPPFNDKVVKEVAEEILSDAKEIKRIFDQDSEESLENEVLIGLYLYDDLIDRNKRCLLAYLNARVEVIERLRWEVGRMIPEEKLSKLHQGEKEYLKNYNDSLDKYMKRYTPKCKHPLDLTANAEAPEDMNIQVRILRPDPQLDGIASNGSGMLRLRGGYQMMVKRSDVEHLIRAGKVMQARGHASLERTAEARVKASRRLRAALLRRNAGSRSSSRPPTRLSPRWDSPEVSIPAVFPFPEPIPCEIPRREGEGGRASPQRATPTGERLGSPASAPSSRPQSRAKVPAVFPFPEPIPHEKPERRSPRPERQADIERTEEPDPGRDLPDGH